MKFDYELPQKYYDFYDIALYIASNKKKIKKKNNKRILGKTTSVIIITMIITLSLLVLGNILYLSSHNYDYIEKMIIIILAAIGILLLEYLYFVMLYKKIKTAPKGTIKIDKEGITDITEDITVKADYNQIEFIYLYNDLGVITMKKTNIYIFFKVKEKEDFIKAVNKYNKDVLIIKQECED